MITKKSFVPPDLETVVNFLNFDFSAPYTKLSKKAVPSTGMRYLIGRCGLDSPRGWIKAKVAKRELLEEILPALEKRNMGPLIAKFNRHVRHVLWDDDEHGQVTMMYVATGDLRAELYRGILLTNLRGEFPRAVKRCKECKKFFLLSIKNKIFCSKACMQVHHNKETAKRVRDSRDKKRLKDLCGPLVKLRYIGQKKGRGALEDCVPDLDERILDMLMGNVDLMKVARQIRYGKKKIVLSSIDEINTEFQKLRRGETHEKRSG